MSAKARSVLLSVTTLVLCLALVAGGTYALFSDGVTLRNHLQAGTLNVTLTRTELVHTSFDPESGLTVRGEPNTERVDFSEPTKRTVFDTEGVPIVPASEYTAKMEIANTDPMGVAFGYWIEITAEGGSSPSDLALREQLNVAVTVAGGQMQKISLGEGASLGGENSFLGVVKRGESAVFEVSVTFPDSEGNNAAKGGNITFDLIVHAVQATDVPLQ